MIHTIATKHAPQAVGPYSQAVSVDATGSRMIFVSGQLPVDPKTGKLVEGSIKEATKQVFENIKAILVASSSSFEDVVRVEVFLRDLNDFQQMNEEYIRYFTKDHYPARQTIQAAKLPLNASIEISCIAVTHNRPIHG